jgi:hypothetical protein
VGKGAREGEELAPVGLAVFFYFYFYFYFFPSSSLNTYTHTHSLTHYTSLMVNIVDKSTHIHVLTHPPPRGG